MKVFFTIVDFAEEPYELPYYSNLMIEGISLNLCQLSPTDEININFRGYYVDIKIFDSIGMIKSGTIEL